ncbi:MAG: hypothetical protein HYY55_03040 [Candidatus Niyogibacteria bacterium]|nr:MAG: hypothetical protein HYY55_03040 [Candidatus Niyogibacteria bacterium]
MFYKIIYISIIIALFISFAAITTEAADYTIDKQAAQQFTTWNQTRDGFIGFLKWLFPLMIASAAVIATLSIIFAGFQWMAGAISPPQVEAAKNRIAASVLGLAVALLSWITLNTINPVFVNPKTPSAFTSECPEGKCPDWKDVLFGVEPSTQEIVKNATKKVIPPSPNIPGDTAKTVENINQKLSVYGKKLKIEEFIDLMSFGTNDINERRKAIENMEQKCSGAGGEFGLLSQFPGSGNISGAARYYVCVGSAKTQQQTTQQQSSQQSKGFLCSWLGTNC